MAQNRRKMKKQQQAASAQKPVIVKEASFLRRLGAFVYDTFMATSIALVVVMLALGLVTAAEFLGWVNLEGAQHADYLAEQLWFQFWIWFSVVAFYIGFWTKKGETIGMRAWQLRVQNADGSNITTTQALIRLFTAAFGLGNLMALFTKNNQSFQDSWAKTQMIYQPKAKA